jgi:hypothetical protein
MRPHGILLRAMSTIGEVERLALDLSESDRALLAAHLLQSLPGVLNDEDGGVAEALRRDAELQSNPGLGMSLKEFEEKVRGRRKEG